VQSVANSSLGANPCSVGRIQGDCANPGLSAGPNHSARPSLPADIGPISLNSETGNFCQRLGAESPAPYLKSRSFPPLA
jgi:hypothetical protein